MTEEGLAAVNVLSKEGIETNGTLIFIFSLGLSAVQPPATHIIPFIGRLEDIGTRASALIEDYRNVIDFSGKDLEISVASI